MEHRRINNQQLINIAIIDHKPQRDRDEFIKITSRQFY